MSHSNEMLDMAKGIGPVGERERKLAITMKNPAKHVIYFEWQWTPNAGNSPFEK